MFGKLMPPVILSTLLISICYANLEPPTNLKVEWTNNITVKVSWKKPESLPEGCSIIYEYILNNEKPERIAETHFLKQLLTENAAKWMFNVSVRTVGESSSCLDRTSPRVKTEFQPPKPTAVVTDFNCYLSKNDLNCSWILAPSSPVSLTYRVCGSKTNFSKCDIFSRERRFCHIKGNFLKPELCMVAITPNGHISTFKAPKAFILPNMEINETETHLVLKFADLAVELDCSYFNVCYSVCGHETCQDHNRKTEPLNIPYVKSCQYKFRYKVLTTQYCTSISSGWSKDIVYGFTDWTRTVLTIVIPVIVSACVILSCVCFRRNKDILCPDVPHPSIIFKEMINSSKEMKPNTSVYTPVLEPIEPLFIVPQNPGHVGTRITPMAVTQPFSGKKV